MTESALLQRAFQYFRSRRMRAFEKTFAVTPQTRVLDVGGSPRIWDFASVRPRLTILNLASAVTADPAIVEVAGDGCHLPFRSGSFDIVFSNSVIEHVGSPARQQQFAAEIARVGRRYWVQTPNRRAPFEMHVMLPFVHLLPKKWQRAVITRFTPWEFFVKPDELHKQYFFNHVIDEIRLLSHSELQLLFPEANILGERLLGMPKSLVAVRA